MARRIVQVAVLAVVLASTAAFAQGSGGSGAAAGSGATAGSTATMGSNGVNASGSAGTGKSALDVKRGDRSTDAQDRAVDSKIKSICKGC